MSDTDDTDDLLLIPPDFFIIHSDSDDTARPYGPYYTVVDSLITQVNKLENRINSIASTSDTSLLNNSLDYVLDNSTRRTNLMSSFRKYNSWEDIPIPRAEEGYVGSTHSTPQKPRTKFKLNSLPSTPSTDRNSPRRHRINNQRYVVGDGVYVPQPAHNTKYSLPGGVARHVDSHEQSVQSQVLGDIDTFIANVKTIQKHNAARNLNPQFETAESRNKKTTSDSTNLTKPNLKLSEVDQMLHAMESQKRGIAARLDQKEQELGRGRGSVEPRQGFYKERTWQLGDNKGSVPDRGMGMRDTLYDDRYKAPIKEDDYQMLTVTALNSQEPSTSDISARNTDSICSENSGSPSSSELTQLTAYQNKNVPNNSKGSINVSSESDKIQSNAMQVLNMHKNLLSRNTVHNTSPVSETRKQEAVSVHNSEKTSTFSFQNDLFDSNKSDFEPSMSNTLALLSLGDLWNHKTGNDLQNLDQAKFLNKLQEEKLRRQHCEQLIQDLQTRTLELQERLAVAVRVDRAKDEAIVRIHKSWEEAASKIDRLSKERSRLEQEITELKARISLELTEAAKKVDHYENESSKALNLAHGNQEKLVALEKQNLFLTAEIQATHNKLKTLQDHYNMELGNSQQLSKILSQKEIELNENKNILSEARKEVAQSKRAVEICQAELTSVKTTQSQFEARIDEDLEHIRKLEKEKNQLLADIETHKKIEKTLQDDLNRQKDLSERNKIELRNFYQDQVEVVVRDKLKEFQSQLEKAENALQDEIRLRELAVAKAAAVHIQQITEKHALEIHLLEAKHQEEEKLYKIQLSQSQQHIENLHLKFQQQQDRRADMAQQLHRVMEAQWLEAIKIINNGKSPIVSQDKGTNTIDQLNFLKSKSYNNLEEILFKDDKAAGDMRLDNSSMPFLLNVQSMSSMIDDDSYDAKARPVNQISTETPVTSKPQKSRQQMENELQKFVQMLLNKSPGNPTEEKQNNGSTDNLQWQQSQNDGTKSNKVNGRDRMGKPPWK